MAERLPPKDVQRALNELESTLVGRLLGAGLEVWTRVVPVEGELLLQIGLGELGLVGLPAHRALELGPDRLAERIVGVVRYGLAHAPSRELMVLGKDGTFRWECFSPREQAWLRFQRWRFRRGTWAEEDGYDFF